MSFKSETDSNIFIAGANGMVGSAIKREFLKLGYQTFGNKKKNSLPE